MRLLKTIILCLLILPLEAFAKKDDLAHLSGKIEGYKYGSNVIIVDPQGNLPDDPLSMAADGSFKTAFAVQYPTELIFTIEQPQVQFKFYATKNSNAQMGISLRATQGEEYVADVTYTGDNKEVFTFMQSHDYNNLIGEKYGDDELKKMTFASFQQGLRNDIDKMLSDLALLKDKMFKSAKAAEWEKKYTYELMRYADVETTEDKDFSTWWKSQDYNNDMNIASSHVARDYKLIKQSGKNDYDIEFIKELPRHFSNKEIYFACANEHIVKVLATAPVNTDEIYNTYKKLYAGHENDIPDFVKNSYEEAKRNVAGKLAPDFEMEDESGNKIKLSQLRGKLIYIDVWATWCGPCKLEIPKMATLADHYKDDPNVLLVSISIDQDAEHWKQAIKSTETKSNWKQYHVIGALESEFCKHYSIVGIPRFLMIDRNGKVVSLDAPRPGEATVIEMIDRN